MKFQTWKRIRIGTGLKTADDFRRALRADDCEISASANYMLDNPAFAISERETEVDLVAPSFAELGCGEFASRREVYNKAKELGLKLCPEEVGPQLRLQFKDQPKDERLIICIRPLSDNEGNPSLFALSCNRYGEKQLDSQGEDNVVEDLVVPF